MILLVYLTFIAALVSALDPYSVLDIPKDADDRTIKSAYRKLSKQYHPDKNSLPDAHDKFIEIGEAYEILTDPTKKQNYDNFGDPNGRQGGSMNFDFGDAFGQFFGGHRQQHHGPKRGPDTTVNLRQPLKDFFNGKDFEFDVEMNNICKTCTGTGLASKKKVTCKKCGGAGFVVVTRQMGPMIQRMQSPCDACNGKGQTIADPCKTCHGQGTQRKLRHYSVYFSPGTPRNHVHVLEGEGDQGPDFEAGNMILQLFEDTSENWGYRRLGDNLYRTEVLTSSEALAGGWKRELRLFDDETVTIRRKKGEVVIDGQVDVVKGHGMPILNDDGEYGDLYVAYKVLPLGKRATDTAAKEEL